MSTQIRPVPEAPDEAPEQTGSFRARAMAALETYGGADLVAHLATLHDQDMNEVSAQAGAAHASVVEVSAAAALDQQMLTHVIGVVQPMLRASGEAAARSAHYASVLETVRQVAAEAESVGDLVDPALLRSVLNAPAQPAPFRPLTLGIVPSSQYRLGHFREVNGDRIVYLPFVGYSLCQEAEGRPMTTHMTFLRKAVAVPRPALYVEHGLVLVHVE